MSLALQRTHLCFEASRHLTIAGSSRFRLELLTVLLARDWATRQEIADAMAVRSSSLTVGLTAMVRDGVARTRPRDGGAVEYQADRANPAVKLAEVALELAAERQQVAEAA